MTSPNADGLVDFAKGFAKAKAPVLDAMPAHVVDAVNVWLSDMLAAAEANDRNSVNRIAGRIGAKLKDELANGLHQQRRARDRQRG
jgi:hypothetical protein